MLVIPEFINPKLYLQKPFNKNQVSNENESSIADCTESNYNEISNNLINFISFFQRLLKEEIVIQDDQIKANIIVLYETIKEINIYLSNFKLNNNNFINNNSNNSHINIENDDNQFDLSFLIELLYQFLLINSNNISNNISNNNSNNSDNNRIEIFLWIFKIISLIISQDYDKIYIEILISMGLLNYLKKMKRELINIIDTLKLNDKYSNYSNSSDNHNQTNNNNNNNNFELDIYLKIQFLINDIINQTNNFNNSKYIFKKLYFNNINNNNNNFSYNYNNNKNSINNQDYVEITIRQLLYNNVGLGYKIWESSLLISEIILRNSNLFDGKNALELGSGVGLGGIIASKFTNSIILSDFVDSINDNIKFNIVENSHYHSINKIGSSNNIKSNYKIINLDWNNLDECEIIENSFEMVFGSDLIYCQTAAKQIPIVLSKYLKVGGSSLLVLPNCREGIKEFEYDISVNPNLKVIEKHLIKNLGDDGELLVLLLSKTQ